MVMLGQERQTVLGTPRHMADSAMVIELKREGDRVNAALCEDSSVRHLCFGSPEHSKVSLEWLGRGEGLPGKELPLPILGQSSQSFLSSANAVPYFLRAAFQEHVLFLQIFWFVQSN